MGLRAVTSVKINIGVEKPKCSQFFNHPNLPSKIQRPPFALFVFLYLPSGDIHCTCFFVIGINVRPRQDISETLKIL